MYNGLTTADKPALLDVKARGAEWVARDTNNDLYGYAVEPIDDATYGWTTPFIGNVITINAELMKFVAYHEKVNIDLALAQIAEMEKTENEQAQNPLTWNERINQMTAPEKAEFILKMQNAAIGIATVKKYDVVCVDSMQQEARTWPCDYPNCKQCFARFFDSLYTEGAANSAAEVEK